MAFSLSTAIGSSKRAVVLISVIVIVSIVDSQFVNTILEAFVFHGYNKILSLLVVYLSHFWSAILLGVISLIFVHWFRFTRSFSILIYGAVFAILVFLILITLPLLTEQ